MWLTLSRRWYLLAEFPLIRPASLSFMIMRLIRTASAGISFNCSAAFVGSLFLTLALQSAVFNPYVDLLRVHITAEAISLAHDEIHEYHVGKILDLDNLLNRGLIKLTVSSLQFNLSGLGLVTLPNSAEAAKAAAPPSSLR